MRGDENSALSTLVEVEGWRLEVRGTTEEAPEVYSSLKPLASDLKPLKPRSTASLDP